MPLFNHKIRLQALLQEIPDELFARIALSTHVDYYSKVLRGKLIFNLLFYSLLTVDKLGQRGLADVFASPQFRLLFNVEKERAHLAHSSISDRLAVINVDYFRQIYGILYERFSQLYPSQTISGLTLQRVDSSLVLETANKLKAGMTCNNGYKQKKMLKYTVNFDGMYGSCVATHTETKYASESLALPENVHEHFKQTSDHATVYIFDRGQSSTEAFGKMKSTKGLLFVGRLLENRKLHLEKDFDCTFKRFEYGELKQDALVRLYKKETTVSKKGTAVKQYKLADDVFRIIRFRPAGSNEDIVLITNILYLRAETIAAMYRRRWDIEVFFRFLKQEVNFSHFLSLNENGIQIVLYMTLIVAMLIMIYKKENGIGYKTAKRRMEMEMQELIIAIAVVHSGGDLSKVNLPAP